MNGRMLLLKLLEATPNSSLDSARTSTGNNCVKESSAVPIPETKGMYSGIKKALGPTGKGVAPLKSMMGEKITDHGQQMAR